MNHFIWDQEFAGQGLTAGIDEAGRGCLCGPVVIASVVWQPHAVAQTPWFSVLNDSKTLTADKRAWLYPRIIAAADAVKVAVLSHLVVDYLNIFQAAMYGFELVAQQIPDFVTLCVDGNRKPASLKRAIPLVKGDQRASAVSAAGVIAKVTRDHLVDVQHQFFPEYDFLKHKGYATSTHRAAIEQLGPSPVHRKSFAPVKNTRLEPQPYDAELNRVIAQETLAKSWHWFVEHYQHFSLSAALSAMQHFHKQGLPILPVPGESTHLEDQISLIAPEPDAALLPLFSN